MFLSWRRPVHASGLCPWLVCLIVCLLERLHAAENRLLVLKEHGIQAVLRAMVVAPAVAAVQEHACMLLQNTAISGNLFC